MIKLIVFNFQQYMKSLSLEGKKLHKTLMKRNRICIYQLHIALLYSIAFVIRLEDNMGIIIWLKYIKVSCHLII